MTHTKRKRLYVEGDGIKPGELAHIAPGIWLARKPEHFVQGYNRVLTTPHNAKVLVLGLSEFFQYVLVLCEGRAGWTDTNNLRRHA